MMKHGSYLFAALLGVLTACDPASEPDIIDPEPAGEGVAFDEENPDADIEGVGKADTPHTYDVPEELPDLARPEIVVSLETRTVHLFDRVTGFSAVYPTGPGVLGSDGTSITPSGFYETGPDNTDGWYYVERRYAPDYFGGFPFLRLTIPNSKGYHTYGFHGPISYSCPEGGSACDIEDREWFLRHDYVSHGCMRMDVDDIVELFWSVREFESVPVAIIDGTELDADGNPVDLGSTPTLFKPGESIPYAECGSRPDPYETPWTSRHC